MGCAIVCTVVAGNTFVIACDYVGSSGESGRQSCLQAPEDTSPPWGNPRRTARGAHVPDSVDMDDWSRIYWGTTTIPYDTVQM